MARRFLRDRPTMADPRPGARIPIGRRAEMRRRAALAVAVALASLPDSTAWAQAPNTSPVLTGMPASNGTPVPRRHDGRGDLSGVWDKAIHQNTSGPVEPLPFTPLGLKAFNDV